MTQFVGFCKATARFSAIATAAQIFLRTPQFTSRLSEMSAQFPNSQLLTVLLDLHIQLSMGEKALSIHPLIHAYAQQLTDGPVPLFAYFVRLLLELERLTEAPNPFTDLFFAHGPSDRIPLLPLTPAATLQEAAARACQGRRLGDVVFCDARALGLSTVALSQVTLNGSAYARMFSCASRATRNTGSFFAMTQAGYRLGTRKSWRSTQFRPSGRV
jgi:hypothetical protein